MSGLRVPQGQLPERMVRSGQRLHHTCPCPRDTFPENSVELRPLIPGVTPGLFEFSPETQGSSRGAGRCAHRLVQGQPLVFGPPGNELRGWWAKCARMAQLPHPRGRSPEIFEEIGGSVRLLAHSAHLRTVRRRVEQCTRALHQTWPYPQGTFPENLVELRPLLPGFTPGLFVFQGNIDQGSCCNLGGKIGDDSRPNLEGLYLRSPSRY